MAKVNFAPGHEYDLVSPAEMHAAFEGFNERMDQFVREATRGVKPIRIRAQSVTVAGSGYAAIISNAAPKAGYVWSVQSVVLGDSQNAVADATLVRTETPSDITAGATSYLDMLLVAANNGAIVGYGSSLSYSKGSLLLNAGEHLVYLVSNGATGANFSFIASAVEVPAEMVGKLYL